MRPLRFGLGFLLLLLILVAGFTMPAFSQQVTAAITGTITDPSGAPIPGAAVVATDTERGVTWPTQTNEAGVYSLPRLPIGTYTLKVEATGFQTAAHPPFTLVLNQAAKIDVQMKVGAVTETLEVTGAAPVLQTQTTELSTVLDARANASLPLASRNYNQLTLLAPGAVSTNPQAFTGETSTFQSGRPYINGNREQTNNYILDGMDNNQIDNNDVAYAPNVDAIQEFNLITQNAPADFGNYLGGLINVSIKSGTNNYHGSVFEFFRNDVLNANQWANGLQSPALPKPKLRWNQFGGTFGGPIVKKKLFFFADYQGSRFDRPASASPYTVFTAKMRAGDFSEIPTPLRNPFTGALVPNNNFAAAGIPFSPAAAKILSSSLYPAPINGATTNNQVNIQHSQTNGDQGDLKIDWLPSEKDHIYGRYSQQAVRNPTTNSQLLLGDSLNDYPLKNFVLDYSRVISTSFVNEARVGFSYFPVFQGFSNPTGKNLGQEFGIPGVTDTFLPQQQIHGQFVNSPGNGIGNNDLKNTFNDAVIQFSDTATLTHGKHSFSTGFQMFRYRTNIFYPGNEGLAGFMDYDGRFTGAAEADFLLGLPQQIGLGAGTGARGLRNTIFGAFLQDNWRATNNLTLNLGLRWELSTPRSEVQNRVTNYGLTSGEVILAGHNGSGALYKQYNGITNFQPRIGFAWSPSSLRNTVIRGAYGISSFTESTGTNNLLFRNPPWTVPHNVTFTTAPATSVLDQGFTAFTSGPACTVELALASDPACFSGVGIHIFDPDFRPAVSQQWNLSVQRQLGNSATFQIGYVGQKTDHLVDIYLANQLVLNADGTTSPSPFLVGNPALKNAIGQARVTESAAYSNYHALQAVFQKRLSNGLQFQANYTWSKCLGNSSGFFAQYGDAHANLTQAGNDYFFFQNTYDKGADYGPCPNDIRHAFNGYVTYDLPFGRNRMYGKGMNPVVNALVGDWQVNMIFNLHSGFPITAQAADVSGTGSGFPRAECIAPPRETPYKKVAGGYSWFDPSGVATPAAGTFGSCSVGSYRGPNLKTTDVSLSKYFAITERQQLEFRAEAINFTNTPILAAPGDHVGASFGLVNAAQGERNIQLGLKYHF